MRTHRHGRKPVQSGSHSFSTQPAGDDARQAIIKKDIRNKRVVYCAYEITAQAASRRRSINACMAVRPETNAKSELHFVFILIRESANRIVGTPLSFPRDRRVHPSGNAQPYPRRYAEQRRRIHAASCRTIRPRSLRPAHRTCPRGSRRDNRPACTSPPLRPANTPFPRRTLLPAQGQLPPSPQIPRSAPPNARKPPMFSNYSHICKYLSLATIEI